MKNKIFALLFAFVFIAHSSGIALAGSNLATSQDDLISLLPASDGVMTLNARKLFGEALPTILASNPTLLSEILSKVDEIQSKTGIDFRKFDQVAIGIAMKRVKVNEIDFDPVLVARGNFSSGGLVSVVKLASNGTYREEKIGDRTVYVFSAKDIAAKNAPKSNSSLVTRMIGRAIDGLTKEVALTALDGNTLTLGSLARVRATVEAKTRVEAEISAQVRRKPSSIMSFAVRTPDGLSSFIPLDNDELGKNVDSIRYVTGSLDVVSGNGVLQLAAKTMKAEQAQGLLETLEGLQILGKALLGSSGGTDKQVYARMIDNAKITRSGSEVMLDLQVPKSDMDVLVGAKK
ncbi:MAG: hypothetical protein WBD22_03805 [Pyrinomonadaceae bacterium]